jgi:hypothetical protein
MWSTDVGRFFLVLVLDGPLGGAVSVGFAVSQANLPTFRPEWLKTTLQFPRAAASSVGRSILIIPIIASIALG